METVNRRIVIARPSLAVALRPRDIAHFRLLCLYDGE
jgi:hypothetical protein